MNLMFLCVLNSVQLPSTQIYCPTPCVSLTWRITVWSGISRVATNLENLEYSWISLNMENSGNSVQPQGKIVTNKVFLDRHSNICVKQLLSA